MKILLVEDNPGDALLMKEMAGEFETIKPVIHHVLSLKAVKDVKDTDWDIILLDLTLEDAAGMELLTEVQEKFGNTPVIIFTGMSDGEMIRKVAGQGVQDYLMKSSVDKTLLERSILYAIWRSKYFDQRVEMETALREKKNLEEINERLNRTLHQLERSNKRLEEFAYVATHNLRAPMVNLTSLVELYPQTGKDDEVFEKIRFTTDQMNSTLNDLIDIALKNKQGGEKKEVRFDELLDAVKMSIAKQVEEAGAAIRPDFSAAPSIIYPHAHLQSIMQNLLTNAIKYRELSRPLQVEVRTFREEPFICLSVKDNGIGIDLEKYGDKLFKAFQRLHLDRQGKGLGLYIIRSQVESMGGHVDVKSEPGKGTEFRVYLLNDPET
jgi:signal transduction histidine kinase